MARVNPQWRGMRGEVLVVFNGPHAYVSPAWYEEPGTVPTWNYVAVHAYGTPHLVEDRDGLLEILRRSVRAYEGPRPEPWAFDESLPHVEGLLRAIVGFRIEITRLEGKLKLRAQNLMIFLQMADGVDDETWNFHLRGGHYSGWFQACIKDDELAKEARAVEAQPGLAPEESRRLIREACAAEGGVEVDTQGDAFFFAFPTAPGALAAARGLTEALAAGQVSVRVGVHTGTPLLTGEGYVGGDVHRAARIAAAGHGGQVLVSASTATLVIRGAGRRSSKRTSAMNAVAAAVLTARVRQLSRIDCRPSADSTVIEIMSIGRSRVGSREARSGGTR